MDLCFSGLISCVIRLMIQQSDTRLDWDSETSQIWVKYLFSDHKSYFHYEFYMFSREEEDIETLLT